MGFLLNAENVVHDTIDGEVLAIRSDTGAYYSMQGPAATAWCALVSGGHVDHLAVLVAAHHGVDEQSVGVSLRTFAESLVAESLLRRAPADAHAAEPELPPETRGQEWDVPAFEKYTDMQDLLLFDPIHEVQPQGWPLVARDGE